VHIHHRPQPSRLRAAPVAALLALGIIGLVPGTASAADLAGQTDLIRPTGGVIRSIQTAFDSGADDIDTGDITNDGFDEILVANAGGSSENGRVDVLDAFGFTISSFGTAYDDRGDALAAGDITNDGAEEVLIANAGGSGENGRVDVLDLFGFTISSFGTAYDDEGDTIAVGDITGDGAEDIVIANDEGGGRMDVVDLFGATIASFGNTGYDGDDTVDVGDITGDGRAEIVVANTEGGGRVDVYGGTGGLLSRFSTGIDYPLVRVDEMTGDPFEEIAVVGRVGQTNLPVGVLDFFGVRITTLGTTFTPALTPNRVGDGFALGQLNGDARAEVVVANV